MAVDFIVGNIGDGKTCLETWFCHDALDSDTSIYANYDLYNIPYYDIKKVGDLKEINTQKNLIAIDEGWITADSRRSGSILNITFSHKMLQSRKIGKQIEKKPIKTNVLISTQDFNQVDVRIRNICRYIYKPKVLIADDIDKPIVLMVDMYNYQSVKFKKVTFPIPMQFNFKHGYVDIPESYDTYEDIESLEDSFMDRYGDIIEKYKDIDLKKGDLTYVLLAKEDLNKSECSNIAGYIKAMQSP